ncbi:telomeric repeat-binding factor 2-interacting protein 1 [Anoplophora glabripennis]|uniref:Telomeric repeat-binding factor 2-interacting protein 1 n=1 Tax=Anoplophora glabripennis TaxID=217634 RepID=V5FU28_ANOGL|nr:telomeric repeat-binding factor 2-interacting protein 1 [Anoplophora glabripennis]
MSGYRPIYTADEDTIILKFIIATQSYYQIRGKSLWEDMANSGLIDRTWMSLKERFDKHILPRINDSRFDLSATGKKHIELGHYQLSLKIDDVDEDDDSGAEISVDSDSDEEDTKN